ncbi:MAG: DNA-directed RNA polymerase subunit L [Candidatus Thermoplasmatota archaeon]
MQINIVKKTNTEIELEISDENETILNPITHTLLEDENVEYAACIVDHPLSNKRRLYLRVKKGKPEEYLQQAVKKLENEVKEFKAYFEVKENK